MAKRRVYRESVVQPLDQFIRSIPLTKGQVTVVDAVEYARLMRWNWFVITSTKTTTCYAARIERTASGKNRLILMHRFIAGTTGDVDHRDGDGLNNRRTNLRPCTDIQNGGNQKIAKNNTSGFKGVSWHKPTGKWIAHVYINRKQVHLGLFADKIDAARAYNLAAVEHFGDFARLNHLPSTDI